MTFELETEREQITKFDIFIAKKQQIYIYIYNKSINLIKYPENILHFILCTISQTVTRSR